MDKNNTCEPAQKASVECAELLGGLGNRVVFIEKGDVSGTVEELRKYVKDLDLTFFPESQLMYDIFVMTPETSAAMLKFINDGPKGVPLYQFLQQFIDQGKAVKI